MRLLMFFWEGGGKGLEECAKLRILQLLSLHWAQCQCTATGLGIRKGIQHYYKTPTYLLAFSKPVIMYSKRMMISFFSRSPEAQVAWTHVQNPSSRH